MQDSRGYMWFGTDNGATRFDGYTFKPYGAKEGLTSNVVFDIHEDSKGRIWFGTMTGEAFILEGDTIVPYRFNHLVQRYRKQFNTATLIYLQKDEVAYFALAALGVLRIDSLGRDSLITTERPFSRLMLEIEGFSKLLQMGISRTYDKNFEFWSEYQIKRRKVQMEFVTKLDRFQIELPINFGVCRGFNAQLLSSRHLLVFSCNQLYCFQDNELLWVTPFVIQTSKILEDETQAIWFCGIEGKGLRRYRNLQAIKDGAYDLFLEGLSISNVYTDVKGGLWITTLEEGVFYCTDRELLIYDSRFGLSSDFVSVVTFKNEQELFAGCENGDIFEVNLAQGRIKEAIANPHGYHNFDLLYLHDQDVLWSNATYWKDKQWHFVKSRYLGVDEFIDLKTSKFEKLHIDEDGNLLGCHNKGFLIIDTKNDTVKFASYYNNLRERTFALHTDSKQRLWVGNARGIFEFQDSVLVAPEIDHPAFHSRVEDIHEFPNGSLIFGAKGWGIVRWQGAEFLHLSTDEGLNSNMIEDVHVDENAILWVGTLNGLNKVTFDDTKKPVVRQFTMANGLPSNEIYKIRSYEGQVWLCTSRGLVRFHEQAEDTASAAPVLQDLSLINCIRYHSS
jgi:hypothetical protein